MIRKLFENNILYAKFLKIRCGGREGGAGTDCFFLGRQGNRADAPSFHKRLAEVKEGQAWNVRRYT